MTASLSIPSLPGLLAVVAPMATDSGNAGNAPAAAADNFQLLLAIGNDSAADAAPPQPSVPAPPSPVPPMSKANASALPAVQNANPPVESKSTVDTTPPRPADTAPQAQNSPPAPQNNKPAADSSPAPVASVTQPHAGDDKSADATADGGDSSDSPPAHPSLSSQLGDINQLLLAIMQLLMPAMQAQAVPPAGDNAAPVVAADSQATPASSGMAALSPQDMALLKDIQATLQQLQQALPGQDAAQAPLQNASGDAAAPDIDTLVQAFQQEVSQLTQSLAQEGLITLPPAAAPPQGDIGALLKNNIDQLQTQLQKLMPNLPAPSVTAVNVAPVALSASATVPVPPAQSPPPPVPVTGDAALMASNADAAQKNTPAADPVKTAANAAIASAPVAQAAADTSLVAPPPVAVTPVAAPVIPVIAPVEAAQNGASSSGGDNAGQGQGQAMPQPIVAPGTAQPQNAGAAGNASFANALAKASPAGVLQQVAVQVKTALGDGSSKIHIQLDPAELGKVDIKLSVQPDGKTGVVITADNKNTLDLLQRDTQGLMRALTDAGLATDSGSLNFNLSGQGQGQGGQPGAQAALTYQQAQPEADDEPALSVVTRSYVVNLADGLDIRI